MDPQATINQSIDPQSIDPQAKDYGPPQEQNRGCYPTSDSGIDPCDAFDLSKPNALPRTTEFPPKDK